MARSLFIFSLPILLSLFLLADATTNNLLPFRKQENNEDDSLILQDAFEQNSKLRLPSESENEMVEVPEMVRTPWKRIRGPPETHNRFSASPGLREGESDSIFRPTEGEEDSISPLRKGESDSVFLGRGGIKGMRFGRHGAGCHHQHHHGSEMKFGHYVFTSPEDVSSFRNFPREFIPRDEKEFPQQAKKEEHNHGKHQRPSESEGSGFEPRERAFERTGRGFPEREHAQFERIGKDFPEREHTQFEHTGKGFPEREHGHGQRDWKFRNEDEQKHGRQEDPAAPWTDWLRSLLPRH